MLPDPTEAQVRGRPTKRITREGAWVLGGQCASVVGSIALVNVGTRYLDPERYGQLSLALVVAGLGNQLILGGVAASIARHLSIAVEKNHGNAYWRDSVRFFAAAALIVLLLGLTGIAVLFALDANQWIALGIAAIALSITGGLTATLSGVQNAARHRASAALHGGADAWLKIALSVMLLESLGASPISVVIGYAASATLIAASQTFALRNSFGPQGSPSTESSYLRSMLTFAWPFSAWGLFAWLQLASDRWALAGLATPEDVGQYAVLYQLGFAPLATLTTAAVTLLAPILYQRSGDATDRERNTGVHRMVWKAAGTSLVLTAILFLVAMLIHEPLFRLLVASDFRTSAHLLPWMVLAGGLHAAGQVLALKLLSELKTARMTAAKIVSSVAGVALNIAGAAWGGLLGVVIAQIAFAILYLAWMAALTARRPASDTHAGITT